MADEHVEQDPFVSLIAGLTEEQQAKDFSPSSQDSSELLKRSWTRSSLTYKRRFPKR